MRKILLILLLCIAAWSQVPQTPNIGLSIPNNGTLNWGTYLNANASELDLLLSGNAPITKFNFSLGNPGAPVSGANLFVSSQDNTLHCTLPGNVSCNPVAAVGSPGQVQIAATGGALAASCGLVWDNVAVTFKIQPCSPATSIANFSAPSSLCANFFNGTSSTQDCYTFTDVVLPLNSATARSEIHITHAGTTGNSNGPNFTWNFDPQGNNVGCNHDDIGPSGPFTSNAITCISSEGTSTAVTSGTIAAISDSPSGMARTSLVNYSSINGMWHGWIGDPNANFSKQEGASACTGGANCYNWFLWDQNGGTPKIYLGGDAWQGGVHGALKIGNIVRGGTGGQDVTFYGPVSGNSTATVNWSAVTTANGTVPMQVGAGLTVTTNGGLAYNSTDANVHTAIAGNDHDICTDAAVCALYAPLASPALTGTPTAPTATLGTNTNQIATTAFVLANAGSSSAGTVTYTTSHTAGSADNGKLMLFNCSSACALTLPNPQPSTTWSARVETVGSSAATVTLGSSITYNGGGSVPVLNSFRIMAVYANSATATDYDGEAPLIAGSGLQSTPTANGFTLALTTALPNGTAATTQALGDATTKLATDQFVANTAYSGNGNVGVDMLWTNGVRGTYWGPTSTGTPTNNTMFITPLVVETPLIVGHATFDVTTAGTSETMFACVYNANGSGLPNSLVWSGSIAVNTTNAKSISAAQVTLNPGLYWVGFEQTGTTGATVEVYNSVAAWINIINANGARAATTANAVSGSACPSSTGTLTAQSSAGTLAMILEP